MYAVIKTYIDAKIAYLNTILSIDLIPVSVSLEMDTCPANQLQSGYELKLGEYERLAKEGDRDYSVGVSLKLSIGLYKDITDYTGLIDTYIHPLEKLLKVGNTNGAILPATTSGITLNDITNMRVTGLKEIVKTSYIQPEINFDIILKDNN